MFVLFWFEVVLLWVDSFMKWDTLYIHCNLISNQIVLLILLYYTISLHSSYLNNAVKLFLIFGGISSITYYYNFLFSDPHVAPLRILLQIYELEKLKYLFLNLCQMIFPQNMMILNNLQDMRIRLIKTMLINKDYN